MTSPFLARVADLLAAKGITVHRFEFPYMAARADGGSRRPAPRAETLVGDYCDAIAECGHRVGRRSRLFIGGKSMGGRVACLSTDDPAVAGRISGVVVLGFPLVPPRKPHLHRGHVIENLAMPALIVQGTRDPFGGRAAFANLILPRPVKMRWIEDGDHDLAPRRSAGITKDDALDDATSAIAQFCKGD
jgi:predicted alpha/beta-hydrolase family hydrolase